MDYEKSVKLKVYCNKIIPVRTQYGYTKVFIFTDPHPGSHDIFTWKTTSGVTPITKGKYYVITCNKDEYNTLDHVAVNEIYNSYKDLSEKTVHSASTESVPKSKSKSKVDALDILLGLED